MADYLWAKQSDTYNRMDFYGFYGDQTDWTLLDGESYAARWPEDAHVEAQAYSNKKLEDFASVMAHMMIISPRAKKFLEAEIEDTSQLEFLPVRLLSSSGKLIRKTTYFALNVLDMPVFRRFELNDIPGNRPIVRTIKDPYLTLFDRSLAEAITASKLTGIRFGELSEEDEYERF